MTIQRNLEEVRSSLPVGTRLIAVSKTKPVADIMEAYEAGQRLFGENKVQEIMSKRDLLPADIEWHLIGHLQSNKVKFIAPFISMIHSVDSLKLLGVIDAEAAKSARVIDYLLQFHIAGESTKFGFSFDEAVECVESLQFKEMRHVRLRGVMGMATFTDDTEQVRSEFRTLVSYFNILKDKYMCDNATFSEISMGMSDDYRVAVEEGSTMVRVGSKIFGNRVYV